MLFLFKDIIFWYHMIIFSVRYVIFNQSIIPCIFQLGHVSGQLEISPPESRRESISILRHH